MSPEIHSTVVNSDVFNPELTLRPDVGLFADLFDGSVIDAKSAFDDFVHELDILPYLRVMPTRIHSWAAHCPMLLTKIGNANWTTEPANKTGKGRFEVPDRSRFFDVHMEIGVKLGTTKLVVLVHHESSPYIVQAKLNAAVGFEASDRYQSRRKDFIEVFRRECQLADFKFANQWMLIGSAEYDFAGRTIKDVSRWLASMIDEVASAINWTMNKLDAYACFDTDCDAAVIEHPAQPTSREEEPQVAPIAADATTAAVSAQEKGVVRD